jgi:hypothetical protein
MAMKDKAIITAVLSGYITTLKISRNSTFHSAQHFYIGTTYTGTDSFSTIITLVAKYSYDVLTIFETHLM